ncbi:MAG: hypothetical protein ACXABC_06615 [Candidatus Thorarchaeota archaeon]|jgi:hypothetical protein
MHIHSSESQKYTDDIETLPHIIGVVLGHNINEWAGFKAGRIILKSEDGIRQTVKYGKTSRGDIPPIGSFVRITCTGDVLLEVVDIEVLERDAVTISERAIAYHEGLSLVAGRPVGGVLITISVILGGFCLILYGITYSFEKPLALSIYGLAGLIYIGFGVALWSYLGEG